MIKILEKKYFRTLPYVITLGIVFVFMISLLSFAQEENVRAFINKVAHQLINSIKKPDVSLENKRSKVKELIKENFDVVWMSRFAMGVYYRKLSSDQQKKYEILYLNYLVNNYFPILIKYDHDDSYEIVKIRQIDSKDYDAKIKLTTNKTNNPVILKYRVRAINMNYKCLDMVVEGVSTLISQRAEFSSVIQRSGIDYFLEQLASQQKKQEPK